MIPYLGVKKTKVQNRHFPAENGKHTCRRWWTHELLSDVCAPVFLARHRTRIGYAAHQSGTQNKHAVSLCGNGKSSVHLELFLKVTQVSHGTTIFHVNSLGTCLGKGRMLRTTGG